SERYGLALQFGLVGEAMRILQDALLGKSSERPSPAAAMELAALELCTGRLEEGADVLAGVGRELDWGSATDRTLPAMRVALPVLEYFQALFAGEYAWAGELLERLEGPGVLHPQFPTPQEVRGAIVPIASPVVGFESPVEVLTQALPGPVPSNLLNYYATQSAVFSQMERMASYHFLRGFLFLLDGNIREARHEFQRTYIEPPPGWSLRPIAHQVAVGYLQLIAMAEKRAAR